MATKKKAKRGKKKAKGGLFNKSSEETVNPTKKFIKNISEDDDIELTETGKSHFKTLKKQKYIDSMEPPVLLDKFFSEFDIIKPETSSFLELDIEEPVFEGVKYSFKDEDNTWLFFEDKAVMLDFALMPEITIEYQENNILKYSPKLYNGSLFFVSDKEILIYDLANESWEEVSVSSEITSSILVNNENIYLIIDFIKLICLNEKFKENWSFITEGYLLNFPVISDNLIYLTSSDGMLYQLDSTGDIIWSFNSKSAIEMKPLIFGNIIILNSMSGKLFFLSKDEKKELAVLDLGFHLTAKPFISEEILYVFNRRFLYKISTETFKILDIIQLEKPIESIHKLDDYIYITLSDSTGIITDSSFTNISSANFKCTKKPLQHANFLISIDSNFNLLKTNLI